jgi:hypothetical protein
MARPIALIQSSFSLSVSAMKNMLSACVLISNAFALLIVSSAPLIERHLFTCSPSKHTSWVSLRHPAFETLRGLP